MPSNLSPGSLDDALDARLTRALEAAPAPHIPADFAARMAARAAAQTRPAHQTASRRPFTYGTLTLWLGLALLVLAMLLSTRYLVSTPTLALSLQTLFLSEFALLTVYFTLRPTPRS